MNAGLEHWLAQDVDWVLLLTHDARLRSGSVATLREAAARALAYGVLGPVLVRADTGKPYSYGGLDDRDNITAHREERPESAEGIAPCAWVDGTAMLVRAQAYRQAGPIESCFFMYFEEADFCMRVRRQRWAVGVVLDATAVTAPGPAKRPLAYGYLFSRNGLLYAWRAGGARRVATAIESQVRMTSYLASKPYNRRFYDPEFRRFGWLTAIGIWLGMIAAALRRWGPPPPWLQRLGDIKGT
jgi:GT2 family glycosyltransferase